MFYSDGEECNVVVTPGSNTQPLNHAFPLNYSCDTIELRDWTEFERYLEERAMRFLKNPKDPELQYVAVENVSTSDIEQIDYFCSRCELPQMRILYDEEKRLMIVKLRADISHEVIASLFTDIFREMVPLSIRIIGVGSTRFGEVSKRHKEPDRAYVHKTRALNLDWPALVVEVGVLQSLHKLRKDAQYWLIDSDGRVFVVILISISLSTGEVIWEWWEQGSPFGPKTQRHTTRIHPTLMQTVTLPASGPIIGAPFRIPSNKIWNIVPDYVGAEIVFTAEQLEFYSRELQNFL